MTLPLPADLEELVKGAFRSEWGAVVKCTTGPVATIAMYADGRYERSAGSFLSDGFDPGDEFTAGGAGKSGNNGVKVIQSVTAAQIRVANSAGMANEAAGAAVTIAMALPSRQKLAGFKLIPDPAYPWISESFQPDQLRAASIAVRSGKPLQRLTGFYWLTINYPMGTGTSGISRLRGKIIERIYAGRSLVYQGSTTRVRTASPKPFIEKDGWTSGALAFAFQADGLNP